jgi:hypothetical protein
MRNVIVLALVLVLASGATARLPERETPRASDLLRARKLADQVQRRLQMPKPRRGGWEKGGTGWGDSRTRGREEPAPSVRIEVRPPRGRSRR